MAHRSRSFRRALAKMTRLCDEHGVRSALSIGAIQLFKRMCGVAVLVCVHKPVGEVGACAARPLGRNEVETASQDPDLDMPREFVASARGARCHGAVVDDRVRCYAWSSALPVETVLGSVVSMPPEAAYVFKAYTHPGYRGRGLIRECLKAIEHTAASEGRRLVTALVEADNRSSLRAFRNAGFERCGVVFIVKRPWLVRRIGCQCSTPCSWSRRTGTAVDRR